MAAPKPAAELAADWPAECPLIRCGGEFKATVYKVNVPPVKADETAAEIRRRWAGYAELAARLERAEAALSDLAEFATNRLDVAAEYQPQYFAIMQAARAALAGTAIAEKS